jgi:hypothetical protein
MFARTPPRHLFGLLCCLAVLTGSPARRALLGYWNFDEASGNVAHNSVAGGVNGTLMGGASFVATGGARFGAIRFDRATNDYVTFGNNFSFPTGSFSVVAWVRTAPEDTTGMYPLAKFASGSANGYYLAVNDVGDGSGSAATNRAHFTVTGRNSGVRATAVNDGLWHMLVGRCDAALQGVGIEVDATGSTTGFSAPPMVTNTAPFLIGGILDGSTLTNRISGWVDEVRVYDHVLSGNEVDTIYFSTIPEPTSVITRIIVLLTVMPRRTSRGTPR